MILDAHVQLNTDDWPQSNFGGLTSALLFWNMITFLYVVGDCNLSVIVALHVCMCWAEVLCAS